MKKPYFFLFATVFLSVLAVSTFSSTAEAGNMYFKGNGSTAPTITSGQLLHISWEYVTIYENNTWCWPVNFDPPHQAPAPGGLGGEVDVYPTANTRYQIHCSIATSLTTRYEAEFYLNVTVVPPAPPPPTATLSANPVAVIAGNPSTLTWSSTNANSCTGTNFSTGGATSGSVAVTPSSDTAYSVSCTGAGGTANAQASVAVTPALSGSCSVSPTSINTGQSATWTASASGGSGVYSYAWSGTDGLAGSGSSVVGTYSSPGTKTASVVIGSGSQSATIACSNSLSVSTPLQADLTAGSVVPSSATVGTPLQFTALATNAGNAASGDFPAIFQIEGGSVNAANSWLTGLAPGASGPARWDHTFGSSGTYRIRMCSNFNTSWTNIVPESDYGNNCGPWTTVVVSDAPPPPPPNPPSSCTVDNANPTVGTAVTYTANGGSAPYNWTPSGGTGPGSTSNTITRTYSVAGPYTMQVSGNGSSSITCPVVTAGPVSCGNANVSISANPDRVRSGQTSTISWSASGVDSSCTISGPGVNQTVSGASCVIPNGSANPTITAQSVYTINCDSAESSAQAIVNLIPKFIEF